MTRSRNSLRTIVTVALLAMGVGPARAAADPALDLIESSVKEVMGIIYDQPADGRPLSARVRPVLEKSFDFDYATRSAVGPGWRQFTPEQQARTIKLFTDLVIRTYADRYEPGSRPTITWGRPIKPANKRREIPTTVTYEGQNYSIAYKLRETANGWRVYDVVVENVSMVANYRAQFDELFKKGGAEAVVNSLEENLAQVSAPKTS